MGLSETFSEMLEKERGNDWRDLTPLQMSLLRGTCRWLKDLLNNITFQGILAENLAFHTALLKGLAEDPDLCDRSYDDSYDNVHSGRQNHLR